MNYDSQFLKWKMEMIWKNKGCVCPNHLVHWYPFETGYSCYVKYGSSMMCMLWFKRGSIRRPKGKRPKGKGFSFLHKYYRAALETIKEHKEAEANCTCAQPHHLPIWWCKTHGEVTVPMD